MRLFYSIICCFLLIAATSCNDDVDPNYVGWIDVYEFDYPDTTLTASPHTFTLDIRPSASTSTVDETVWCAMTGSSKLSAPS